LAAADFDARRIHAAPPARRVLNGALPTADMRIARRTATVLPSTLSTH
jgi:hypothetical protein